MGRKMTDEEKTLVKLALLAAVTDDERHIDRVVDFYSGMYIDADIKMGLYPERAKEWEIDKENALEVINVCMKVGVGAFDCIVAYDPDDPERDAKEGDQENCKWCHYWFWRDDFDQIEILRQDIHEHEEFLRHKNMFADEEIHSKYSDTPEQAREYFFERMEKLT